MTTQSFVSVGRFREPERSPRRPKYDPEEILGIVNPDIRQPLDMMEVIVRLVDDSQVDIFKPSYGKAMITCRAYIHGMLTA